MNTSQKAWSVIALIIIFIVVGTAGFYIYYQNVMAPSGEIEDLIVVEGTEFAAKCGLVVETPSVGAAVSFPLTISGTINNSEENGCYWTMFEGQAGTAELFYETKDGYSLATDMQPIEVANWMSTSTTFSVTLDFDNVNQGLPSGYNFKILLTEDNPSGEGIPDSLEIPVTLQ